MVFVGISNSGNNYIYIVSSKGKNPFFEYTITHSLTRSYIEKDYEYSSQLIEAIYDKNVTEIEKLLATDMEVNCPNSANVNHEGRRTQFPLEVACEIGDYETAKALIAKGAIICGNLLSVTLTSFQENDVPLVKLLLKHGANAKQAGIALKAATMVDYYIEYGNKSERSNLKGIVEIFKLLEANGANIHEVDRLSSDVVGNATLSDNELLLAYLIEEKKMDINGSAFLEVSRSGQVNSIRYLAEQYMKWDGDMKSYFLPLAQTEAQKNGYEAIVEILSDIGEVER